MLRFTHKFNNLQLMHCPWRLFLFVSQSPSVSVKNGTTLQLVCRKKNSIYWNSQLNLSQKLLKTLELKNSLELKAQTLQSLLNNSYAQSELSNSYAQKKVTRSKDSLKQKHVVNHVCYILCLNKTGYTAQGRRP